MANTDGLKLLRQQQELAKEIAVMKKTMAATKAAKKKRLAKNKKPGTSSGVALLALAILLFGGKR